MSYQTPTESGLITTANTEAIVQAALDTGALYLSARYGAKWPGTLTDKTNVLDWPRASAVDNQGRSLTGVPSGVIAAEKEAARLVLSGASLLPSTVVSASSVSAQAGGQLTRKQVKAGKVETVKTYSASKSESSSSNTVQQVDANGYSIILSIEAHILPIISASGGTSDNNYYVLR